MSPRLESVIAQALELSPAERTELIETLADTVLPAPGLSVEWQEEVKRRLVDMDAGRTPFIPAEEAMATLAARIQALRSAA